MFCPFIWNRLLIFLGALFLVSNETAIPPSLKGVALCPSFWLPLEPLWLLKPPDIFWTGVCYWGCAKTFQCSRGSDLSHYLVSELIGNQILGQQFKSIQIYIYIVLYDHSHRSCSFLGKKIWRWLAGISCRNQCFRWLHKPLSRKLWWGQEKSQRCCLLLMFPESSSKTSRYVAVLKLVRLVEALGQVDGRFTQAGGRCALVHYLCSVLSLVAFLTAFLVAMVFWAQKHNSFWPPEQAIKR